MRDSLETPQEDARGRISRRRREGSPEHCQGAERGAAEPGRKRGVSSSPPPDQPCSDWVAASAGLADPEVSGEWNWDESRKGRALLVSGTDQAGGQPFPGRGRKRMDRGLGRPHSTSAPGGQRSSLVLTRRKASAGLPSGSGPPALLPPVSHTPPLLSPPQPGACGLAGGA